jgi:C4-dicarboxylate-specific signal transduction histidine kinase
LREVTQEREYQTRIQMQERLATVGQLAAGIAHDFNNIMAAILVYADLLRMFDAF